MQELEEIARETGCAEDGDPKALQFGDGQLRTLRAEKIRVHQRQPEFPEAAEDLHLLSISFEGAGHVVGGSYARERRKSGYQTNVHQTLNVCQTGPRRRECREEKPPPECPTGRKKKSVNRDGLGFIARTSVDSLGFIWLRL